LYAGNVLQLKTPRWCPGLCLAILLGVSGLDTGAQSADWQKVVYREPQVRYLLTDLSLGGNPELYRKYAGEERDPDSMQTIKLWDAGVRAVNTNAFERRWVTNIAGLTKPVMRVVFRGSQRTITGSEVFLSSDLNYQQGPMRVVLADLTMGGLISFYGTRKRDPNVMEALCRWADGVRAVNTNCLEVVGKGNARRIVYRGTLKPVDGARVVLNSDSAYPETNVRYFLADINLGGGVDFYRKVAQEAHEMGCLEAVVRWDSGVRITNLDEFERKNVNGKVLITRKASEERINGMEVSLSTD
jgi:hypothetical protein